MTTNFIKRISIALIVLVSAIVGQAQISYNIINHTYTKPDTLVIENTSMNLNSFMWSFPGGKCSGIYDPIVTVIYTKPGFYDVILYGENQVGIIDSLVDKRKIEAPGFLSKDTVFCTYDTLMLKASGGFLYSFYKLGNSPSGMDNIVIYTNYTPTYNTKYIVQIRNKDSQIMTDTVSVTLDLGTTIPVSNNAFCNGDSTAIQLPADISAYLIFEMDLKSDWVSKGNYSNTSPYFVTSPKQLKINWTDTLGCPWNQTANVGDNIIIPPAINIPEKLEICQSDSVEIYTSSAIPYTEWYLNGSSISNSNSIFAKAKGSYTIKAYESSHTCFSADTMELTYITTNADSITSANFLPGIGYALTYSRDVEKIYAPSSYEFFSTTSRIDSLSNNDSGTTAYPIVLDGTTYSLNHRGYKMISNSFCKIPQEKSFVKPVWLSLDKDLDGSNILSWTPYTIRPVTTYYIFRGTSPDNLLLLDKISATGLLEYKDYNAPTNAIYSIGVSDDLNAQQYYSDMLYGWQNGYITSNLNPAPANLKRIGVFAFRQVDSDQARFFKAIAPGADQIDWELEDDIYTTSPVGFTVQKTYMTDGYHDVKVTAHRKGETDSVYLKDFILLGTPFVLQIDTINKKVGNDTLIVDVQKYVHNRLLGLNDSSIFWDMNDINTTDMRIHKNGDSLSIWVNPALGETTFNVKISGKSMTNMYSGHDVAIVVKNTPNKAPYVLINDSIPEIVANKLKSFDLVDMSQIIRDDYTLPQNLQWMFEETSKLSFKVTNGILNITQKDLTWTGTIDINVTAIDNEGLKTSFIMKFTQPHLVAVPTVAPTVSFIANKIYIHPTDVVRFFPTMLNTESIKWSFGKGKNISGSDISPVVEFDEPGLYTISLTGTNSFGDTTTTILNYINVIAISQNDTTICKGDSLQISLLGTGYNSISWNTVPVQTTQTITVSPSTTTTYRVTMKKGLVTITDSVIITIATQANLGKDTIICEGESIAISPGVFEQYFWNGLSTAGASSLQVNKAMTYTVKVEDSLGCESSDTLVITSIRNKPVVNLGKDTTFCWKKTLTLRVSGNYTFNWSNNNIKNSDSLMIDTAGTYSVTVTDNYGCKNADTISINVKIPVVPTLKLVTISSSEKNIVAWEPMNNKGILKYRVWSDAYGVFEVIDSVMKNDSTYIIDLNSTPKSRSYHYALSSIDSACSTESELSTPHGTMLLKSVLMNTDTVRLTWNPYEGIEVQRYIIYRAWKGKPLMPYDTIDVQPKLTSITYFDNKALGLGSYYQVGFNLANQVTPAMLKSDGGPYSQSLSNMAESELLGLTNNPTKSIQLSPNPASMFSVVNIGVSKPMIVTVRDILGHTKMVLSGKGAVNIDCSSLAAGIYIVTIESDKTIATKNLIVK